MKITLNYFENNNIVINKGKKVKNKGFEKVKNNELKYEFQNCIKVKYNPKKHIRLISLGYNTISQLDNLGKRRWSEYFNDGGKVYIISHTTKLPIYKRIIFDKKIKNYIGRNIPLPLKPKQIRREYIRGGKNGKVLGFRFYLISDMKLMPKHRRILLVKSEIYISQIIEEYSKFSLDNSICNISFLDSNDSDLELLESWNKFFVMYGYRFNDFEEEWFKMYGGGFSENEINESDKVVSIPNNLFKKEQLKYNLSDFG
jgi:hypothetical protein